MKKNGFFITFEGIDGCGKSTQLKMADRFLRRAGYRTLVIREPGSTPLSERIRKILLDKKLNINPLSELLLYVAARAELINEVIKPALKKGNTVLCDRFHDSTTAYQGYGRGLDRQLIQRLHRATIETCRLDLTLVIDVDYKTSLSRRKKSPDRLEKENRAFFNRVRRGFKEIARKEKSRVKLINGKPPADEVFTEVLSCLKKKLKI